MSVAKQPGPESAPRQGGSGESHGRTAPPDWSATREGAFERFQHAKLLPNLDGLRGLSILVVLLHHVPEVGGAAHIFQANGRYGVSLFFAISGFLICSLLLRERERHGRIDLRSFYIRRSLRLFPLYYAVLLLYVVLVYGLHQFSPANQELFRDKLPSYLFYFSNLTAVATVGPFFFAWSLAVEEQFYLTFSVLFRWCGTRLIVLLLAGALVAKMLFFNVGGGDRSHPVVRVAFWYAEPILMGVLLAFAAHNRRGFAVLHLLSRRWALGALGLGIVALLSFVQFHDRRALVSQLLYFMMTLLIGAAALRPSIPVLGGRLLSHIGKISYGIYLLHMLVIILVKRYVTLHPWAVFAIAMPAVVLLASLVYRYFEAPILRYKDRFVRV